MSERKIELPPEVPAEEARLLLTVKLFETGRISLGQAARMAGDSRRAFLELLGKLGVAVFDYPPRISVRNPVLERPSRHQQHLPHCVGADRPPGITPTGFRCSLRAAAGLCRVREPSRLVDRDPRHQFEPHHGSSEPAR
jgi:hypothetical protein